MRQPTAFAVAFVIAITSTITGQPLNNAAAHANSKRVELPEGSETAKAIARLGDLSPATIREKLQQLRVPDNLFSKYLQKKIIEAQPLPVVNNNKVEQLKATLQPVLDYHERGQMPICVLRSEQPQAYLVDRAIIFITTRLMEIANEEEIRGIVAHELAHEYIWADYNKARLAGNQSIQRECELFCDAVAAFTLKELGDNPASYGRILARLAIIGIRAGNTQQHKSDRHPSLEVRKKLNNFLCQQLD